MIFNKGLILVLIRVLIIVTVSFGLVYTSIETDLTYTPYMLGGLILIATIELSWSLQKQERNWAQFLHSVKYGDFNRAYRHKTNSKELLEAYDLITESMETLQTNREAELRLLKTVLRHVSVAVICYEESGDVLFTNKAFDVLLDIPGLSKIETLEVSFPALHEVMASKDASSKEWVDHQNGQKLLIKTEQFKLKGKKYRLISLTDIRNPLEIKELESYQNLMRVMTHEIMNSTTPILSLIRVVNHKLINENTLVTLSEKDQRNTARSLLAIEDRTAGILKFVEAYKKINKPIEPQLESIAIDELVNNVVSLMGQSESLPLIVDTVEEIFFHADRSLIDQVLINLLKNAFEAVEAVADPKVHMSISSHQEIIRICIEDNGPGISESLRNEIFVPFFTTKAQGSGIGLSISRKIVLAHKGQLYYQREGEKSRFVIELPH